MALYEVMSTTPCLEQLACETASLLQGKTKVPTKEEGTLLFEYRWTEECAKLFREFSKTKAEDVKHIVATSARAKIPKRRPDEARPLPIALILETGWLATTKNQIVVLISLQTPKDALKEVKLQIRNDVVRRREDNRGSETELLPGSIVLVFESVSFRMVPAGIPFVMLTFPTSPLEVEATEQQHGGVM